MILSKLRRPLLLALVLAAACTSPASEVAANRAAAAPADVDCAEASAAMLPAVAGSAENVGTIIRAAFTRTDLPRADGQIAIVVTDVSARVDRRSGADDLRLDLGYFERQDCWPREMWSGLFYCYQLDTFGPAGGPALRDENTRAFLSVVAYLATGGESDAAAAQVASGAAVQVFIDNLLEQTSAPSHIDRWYYCQSCGNDRARLAGRVSTAGMRFGRSRNSTYFISRSGWVARLSDGERQASYALCRGDQQLEG